MKRLWYLLLVLCLGIFIFPKDNFYAEVSKTECCKSETSSKSCCDSNPLKKHSEESNDCNQPCNDDCCSFCMTCYAFAQNTITKSLFDWAQVSPNISKKHFEYTQPLFSNYLKEIWQPPKIG